MNKTEIEEYLRIKSVFYAKELWDVKYDGFVMINNRLKKKLGVFYASKESIHWIEINKSIIPYDYVVDNVLIHELCHWYLWKTGKGWKDKDVEFILECKRIGENSIYEDVPLNRYDPTDKLKELVYKFERSHENVWGDLCGFNASAV